jgi:hypothetical protein
MSLQILSWQWGTLLAMHVQPNEGIFPPEVQARRREWRAREIPREWALTLANLAAVGAVVAGIAVTPKARDGSSGPSA